MVSGDLYTDPQPTNPLELESRRSTTHQDLADIWRQVCGYILCMVIVIAVLSSLAAIIIFHSETGIVARSVCVTRECKRFALQVSTDFHADTLISS